jgi:hypothetical protein
MKPTSLLSTTLVTLLIFGTQNSFAQTDNDITQIIGIVSKSTSFIVFNDPSGFLNKDKIDFNEISQLLKENALDSIPKQIISDLADNFSCPDFRKWTYSDFPNKILINNRDTVLTYKIELIRLGFTNKDTKRNLKNQINNFNYYQIKPVYRISRPLFHSSGEYAVVQYDNCVNLFGGGVVLLFKKINGKWIDYIPIYGWKC